MGYLTLAAICDAQLADPPAHGRLVVAADCFPTGMLGHYTRRLADGGLVAVLTSTSPPRLGHPDGGPKLASTSPLSIAIPSSDGRPIVTDVSMGRVTYGDVLSGKASADELVPSLVVEGYGAVLVVARPGADPVPDLRASADGLRLPGDT